MRLISILTPTDDGPEIAVIALKGIFDRKGLDPAMFEAYERGHFLSDKVDLYAWSRIEVVCGPEGAMSMKELSTYFSSRQKENLPEMMPLILEASRR